MCKAKMALHTIPLRKAPWFSFMQQEFATRMTYSGTDANEVKEYPAGTQPDRNYRGSAFDFGKNYSPDGVIEYLGSQFGGALNHAMLICRYSGGDDVVALTPASDGSVPSGNIKTG